MLTGLLVSIQTALPLLFRLKFKVGGSNQESQHQGICTWAIVCLVPEI